MPHLTGCSGSVASVILSGFGCPRARRPRRAIPWRLDRALERPCLALFFGSPSLRSSRRYRRPRRRPTPRQRARLRAPRNARRDGASRHPVLCPKPYHGRLHATGRGPAAAGADLRARRSRRPATRAAAHRYSPAHLLGVAPDSLPPIFLAVAGQDQIPRLNESIERFMRAAVEHRVQIDFALHRHGVHGFDQRNRDARTAEILEGVMSFVRRHVR